MVLTTHPKRACTLLFLFIHGVAGGPAFIGSPCHRGVCADEGMLAPNERRFINVRLATLEEEHPHDCGGNPHGYQVAIHIVPRTPRNVAIDTYATLTMRAHNVGHTPCDDGVLIMLATESKTWAIVTGEGASHILTPETRHAIINDGEFHKYMNQVEYMHGIQFILDRIVPHLVNQRHGRNNVRTQEATVDYAEPTNASKFKHVGIATRLLAISLGLLCIIELFLLVYCHTRGKRRMQHARTTKCAAHGALMCPICHPIADLYTRYTHHY